MTTMATVAAYITDIDSDTGQAQAAAGYQHCRQHDGKGTGHHG